MSELETLTELQTKALGSAGYELDDEPHRVPVRVGDVLTVTYAQPDGTIVCQKELRIQSMTVWRDEAIVRFEHSHSVALGLPSSRADATVNE